MHFQQLNSFYFLKSRGPITDCKLTAPISSVFESRNKGYQNLGQKKKINKHINIIVQALCNIKSIQWKGWRDAWMVLDLIFAPDHLNILLEGKWNSSTMCWSLTNQSSPPETNRMTNTLLTSTFTYKLTRPANICLAAILSSMSQQFLAVSFLQGSWKHSENVVLVGATQFVQMAQLHIRYANLWLRLMPKVPCRTVQSGT